MIQFVKNKKCHFWMLQILGWGGLNLLTLIMSAELSLQYLLFSVSSFFLVGISLTSILRYYFKKNISINKIGLVSILKIIISSLFIVIVLLAFGYCLDFLYENYFLLTLKEKKFLKLHDNVWSNLFGSIIIIFGWVICYYGIKFFIKHKNEQAEQLEYTSILKEAELNTLKGQINPHFMFNSLNNIRGLMLEDVEKSRIMLNKLSDMLEYTLVKNKVDAITVRDELEMVENYIDLSKIQFEARLKFVKEIEKETLTNLIPPMTIQLLVENAVKHGISNLKAGGIIKLSISAKAPMLLIEVKNTGNLLINNSSTQIGLKNIKQRLQLLYGIKASFSLKEVEGEVIATIKIPLL